MPFEKYYTHIHLLQKLVNRSISNKSLLIYLSFIIVDIDNHSMLRYIFLLIYNLFINIFYD